jgi:hypothetical protein
LGSKLPGLSTTQHCDNLCSFDKEISTLISTQLKNLPVHHKDSLEQLFKQATIEKTALRDAIEQSLDQLQSVYSPFPDAGSSTALSSDDSGPSFGSLSNQFGDHSGAALPAGSSGILPVLPISVSPNLVSSSGGAACQNPPPKGNPFPLSNTYLTPVQFLLVPDDVLLHPQWVKVPSPNLMTLFQKGLKQDKCCISNL